MLYEILLEIASTLLISSLQTCLQKLKSYLSCISKTVKSTEAVGPFLWWKTLLHMFQCLMNKTKIRFVLQTTDFFQFNVIFVPDSLEYF